MANKPSLIETLKARDEAITAANAKWAAVAEELMRLIPSSLEKFAREKSWIRSNTGFKEVDNYWTLHSFLEYVINASRYGGCNSEKLRTDDLGTYVSRAMPTSSVSWRSLAGRGKESCGSRSISVIEAALRFITTLPKFRKQRCADGAKKFDRKLTFGESQLSSGFAWQL